jgi:ATP-binding cassette subfamily C protein
MLQVYDRVLGSQSVQTLVALTLIMAFLYLMMGLLDYVRGRVMARAAAQFQSTLGQRVFDAMIRKSALKPNAQSAEAMNDLQSIQQLIASPALMAIFDLPWTPLFILGLFLFHPWLGYLAIVGALILIIVTVVNQLLTRTPVATYTSQNARAQLMSTKLRTDADMIDAMGMRKAAFLRWNTLRDKALDSQIVSSDLAGVFTAITKTFRMFLQSAMLGLGAYLVLQGEITAGVMIAGSILMGRALAPIEQAVGQWSVIQRGMKGWGNLCELLGEVRPEPRPMDLPVPRAILEVNQLSIMPPKSKKPALRLVSFHVEPGQAIGVIGPSGSGKSTLARAITGAWKPAAGQIRLDGATLDQYDPTILGSYIGYLPQRVQLLDGTIAENIARLSPKPDAKQVIAAAKKAGVHEMILSLPKGYDTPVSASLGQLAGGQMQRIGLARALYGDPVILVLDEPNSNLDNEGNAALNAAIRQMKLDKKSVLVMAHRPAAILECDKLLMLKQGQCHAYGPRDEIMRSQQVKNHQDTIQYNLSGGGAA